VLGPVRVGGGQHLRDPAQRDIPFIRVGDRPGDAFGLAWVGGG